ncbi:MAG: tetratricopeptide repeat protein [Pirellulaceae bacterium]
MEAGEAPHVAWLRDRKVCATGRLVSWTHVELAKLVRAWGGTYVRTPTRGSLVLVVGDHGWPAEEDGSTSRTFARALRWKAFGYPIEFLTEDEFLERLGLTQSAAAIRGSHTLSDLSRILGISPVRLRRWVRDGLIRPTSVACQLPYFDFHQVAFLKRLQELFARGASPATIRRGLEQVEAFLPGAAAWHAHCAELVRDGRVLLRLGGQLLDQTGQRYFDFGASEEVEPAVRAEAVQLGFHDLCDEGLAREEAGQLAEAADAYERALQLKPEHAILHFDLGNVLFQLGRIDESLDRFRAATTLDGSFAQAWHNLGSVLAHRGAWEEAESALRQALDLLPDYADSHATLAEVLRVLGRVDEAAWHERTGHELSKADQLTQMRDHCLRVWHAEVPSPEQDAELVEDTELNSSGHGDSDHACEN